MGHLEVVVLPDGCCSVGQVDKRHIPALLHASLRARTSEATRSVAEGLEYDLANLGQRLGFCVDAKGSHLFGRATHTGRLGFQNAPPLPSRRQARRSTLRVPEPPGQSLYHPTLWQARAGPKGSRHHLDLHPRGL